MNRIVFFCCLALILNACEGFFSSTLEVEPPPHEAQMVLHTVITDVDTVFYAAVGQSVGILDNRDREELFLNDAEITFYEGEQKWFDLDLRSSEPGEFVLYNFEKRNLSQAIEPGQTYTYTVKHPSFGEISASQTMPQPVPITETIIRDDHSVNEDGQRTDQAEITFTDPGGSDHYYEIALLVKESLGTESFYNPIYTTTLDPNLSEGLDQSFLLSDESFNGKEYKILLDFSPYWTEGSDVAVYAVWRTVTRDYFLYTKSVSAQEAADDFAFFAEPVSLHTNINNGLGIFGMRTETLVRLSD
ncbi:MAG: DUF4249 domain-containing protein [Bacteroidota bacterium]